MRVGDMSYPINYPTPQGANVQIFRADTTDVISTIGATFDWVKPQGASFVWFTLIGGGGLGGAGGASGGGSGAVTNFMCPAFLIPDVLRIRIGKGNDVNTVGFPTTITYQAKDGTGYTLLTANSGAASPTSGAATAANAFTAMGFYQSVAGQDGSAGAQAASATTFLSGGGGNAGAVTANYGYTASSTRAGYFQMQPIIVGVGGGGGGAGKGGVGCGGGDGNQRGGPGMVVIITW